MPACLWRGKCPEGPSLGQYLRGTLIFLVSAAIHCAVQVLAARSLLWESHYFPPGRNHLEGGEWVVPMMLSDQRLKHDMEQSTQSPERQVSPLYRVGSDATCQDH